MDPQEEAAAPCAGGARQERLALHWPQAEARGQSLLAWARAVAPGVHAYAYVRPRCACNCMSWASAPTRRVGRPSRGTRDENAGYMPMDR
eukprot:scaffold1152_cov175-Prasinococcus_capsulatus_cf.AAC.1